MKRLQIWMGMAVLAIAGCGGSALMPPGKPPVIQAIMSESSDVRVGSGIRLKAKVSSESGNVSYAWQADAGLVTKPDESSLVWLAPSFVPFTPFPVTITLSVTDEYGRVVRSSQQIRVHQQEWMPL